MLKGGTVMRASSSSQAARLITCDIQLRRKAWSFGSVLSFNYLVLSSNFYLYSAVLALTNMYVLKSDWYFLGVNHPVSRQIPCVRQLGPLFASPSALIVSWPVRAT